MHRRVIGLLLVGMVVGCGDTGVSSVRDSGTSDAQGRNDAATIDDGGGQPDAALMDGALPDAGGDAAVGGAIGGSCQTAAD